MRAQSGEACTQWRLRCARTIDYVMSRVATRYVARLKASYISSENIWIHFGNVNASYIFSESILLSIFGYIFGVEFTNPILCLILR